MRTIKTYFKRAPFYNALIRHWTSRSAHSSLGQVLLLSGSVKNECQANRKKQDGS